MRPKTEKDKSSALAAKAIMPLVKLAQSQRGTVTRVAERLTNLSGKKVHRQIVEGWLHPDEIKRTEPQLGMGLMLIQVRDELIPPNEPRSRKGKAV